MNEAFDVIVVGGGHNGLVAGFYLARSGLKTLILERRSYVGGACVTEELFDGYRVSSCSYVCWLLQPKVIADLQLRRRGFSYTRMDPFAFFPQADGSHLFLWEDTRRTQHELARLNEHDATAFPAWNSFWKRAAGLINRFFLDDPPTREQLREHARQIGEEALLDQLLSTSFGEISHAFFEDERIRAALGNVQDVGDAWTPGSALTAAFFSCNEFADVGHAVVHGGMGSITQAMAHAVLQEGGEIRTDADVSRILVDRDHVYGVRLVNGRELRAPLVVSNADPKRTFLRLIDARDVGAAFRTQVEALSTKASYMKFHSIMRNLPDASRYLGREATAREVANVKIAPSLAHYRNAYEQALAGEPADEPIVHVQIPTVYDNSLTKRAGHIVSMWVLYAPANLAHGTWGERRIDVGESLIDYVSMFIPNFRDDILDWRLFAPPDLEHRIGLTDGCIRHLDIIPTQFLDQRPLPGMQYQSPIEGLFLCGAGTHPGGEVTGAPGHNAAAAILRTHRPRQS